MKQIFSITFTSLSRKNKIQISTSEIQFGMNERDLYSVSDLIYICKYQLVEKMQKYIDFLALK